MFASLTPKYGGSFMRVFTVLAFLKGPILILVLRKTKRNRVCLHIEQRQGRVKQRPAITDNHGSSSACSIEFWGKN